MVTLSDTTLCPPTIVPVEDSKGDAHIIQEAVDEQIPGSRLEHIEDAPRALKFLDDLDSSTVLPCPAVFVVDLNLPGGWGGSVVERIRGGRCRRVPILISTRRGSTASRSWRSSEHISFRSRPRTKSSSPSARSFIRS